MTISSLAAFPKVSRLSLKISLVHRTTRVGACSTMVATHLASRSSNSTGPLGLDELTRT